MSEHEPQLTLVATRAHANALGILVLCRLLRDKGVLDDADICKVRNAMVSVIETSPIPASPEVNAVRAQFDAEFAKLMKQGE